jgi:hypothetical protein
MSRTEMKILRQFVLGIESPTREELGLIAKQIKAEQYVQELLAKLGFPKRSEP